MSEWTHDGLAEDLAEARDTTLRNVPLGSVWLNNAQLADVVTIEKSYTRFCLTIFEVKVSRSDFLKDVRSGKYKGYLEHCHRLYFAAPAGMVSKSEIPVEAGLVVRGDTGWQFQKSAPTRKLEVPRDTLLSMIFLKARSTRRKRALEAIAHVADGYTHGKTREELVARKVGKDIAQAWAAREKWAQKERALQSTIDIINNDLSRALGVDSHYPTWDLSRLVRDIERKAKALGVPLPREVSPDAS